jgi:hypothetical protein
MDGQNKLFDGLPLRHLIAHQKDTWHGFLDPTAAVGEVRHGFAVVWRHWIFAGNGVENCKLVVEFLLQFRDQKGSTAGPMPMIC